MYDSVSRSVRQQFFDKVTFLAVEFWLILHKVVSLEEKRLGTSAASRRPQILATITTRFFEQHAATRRDHRRLLAKC